MLKVDVSNVKNVTADLLYQWDKSQKLQIIGANDAIELHFANKRSTRATVVESVMVDDVVTVDIPDDLLEQPYDIVAYGYENGQTVFTVTIPVIFRVQPDDR